MNEDRGRRPDEWERARIARRHDLIVRVRNAEAQLDMEHGNSRPEHFWYLADQMLRFAIEVVPDDDAYDEEEWATTWQLGYWPRDGKWQFLLADEVMPRGPDDDGGLMAPEIRLVDAPNAALLFYGRRIEEYADQVRGELRRNEESDERRGRMPANERSLGAPKR